MTKTAPAYQVSAAGDVVFPRTGRSHEIHMIQLGEEGSEWH